MLAHVRYHSHGHGHTLSTLLSSTCLHHICSLSYCLSWIGTSLPVACCQLVRLSACACRTHRLERRADAVRDLLGRLRVLRVTHAAEERVYAFVLPLVLC